MSPVLSYVCCYGRYCLLGSHGPAPAVAGPTNTASGLAEVLLLLLLPPPLPPGLSRPCYCPRRDTASGLAEVLAHQPRALQELRLGVDGLRTDLEVTSKAVSGLNTALSSTGAALEIQAHKISAQAHKLGHVSGDLGALRELLLGGGRGGGAVAAVAADPGSLAGAVAAVAAAGAAREQGGSSGCSGGSLVQRLATAERGLQEVAAGLAGKVSEGAAQELERRLAAVQRQADHSSEGVRTLTNTTYKRVDEHASAIQRLTLAISSNLDDR